MDDRGEDVYHTYCSLIVHEHASKPVDFYAMVAGDPIFGGAMRVKGFHTHDQIKQKALSKMIKYNQILNLSLLIYFVQQPKIFFSTLF